MSKGTRLKLASLLCFWMAYRYAAHGVTLKDSPSLTIGYAALIVAILLAVSGFWIERK